MLRRLLLLLTLCVDVGSQHLLRHMASHVHTKHGSKSQSPPQPLPSTSPRATTAENTISSTENILDNLGSSSGTNDDAESGAPVFHQGHNCSKYGLTVRDVRQWSQWLSYNKTAHHTEAKESYLTITTVLGGWVQLDQVREWIFWHYYVVGADKFVFYLINAEPQLRSLLTEVRAVYGIDIRLTTVKESKLFWDATNNNMRIMKRISDIFARAVNMERESSEWLACIDIDEFIAPGTAAGANYNRDKAIGQSFVSWLRALPAEVDWVYLRWVWHPVDDYTDATHYRAQKFFESAVTHSFTSRVSDVALGPLQEANSGKSIIKPMLFTGENSIHQFTPKEPRDYNSRQRKAVPSTSSRPVLPKRCNSWETGGRLRPKACRRVEDSFVLNHYRRKSFNHRPKDDTVKRPMDLGEKVLVDVPSPALCASVAITCSVLATGSVPLRSNGTRDTTAAAEQEGLFSLRNESAGGDIASCAFPPRKPLQLQSKQRPKKRLKGSS